MSKNAQAPHLAIPDVSAVILSPAGPSEGPQPQASGARSSSRRPPSCCPPWGG